MNGPSDEIGPLERLWHNGDFAVWEGQDAQARAIEAGSDPLDVIEDAPVEGQAHLRSPDDVAVPIGTREGDMIYKGLVFEGHPVWERATEDEKLALQAREEIPRSTPKTRRPLREMFAEDERREAERQEQARKYASTDPLDRLEVYMERRIWADMKYDEPLDAQEALDDALEWLKAHTVTTVATSRGATVRIDRWFT